MQDAPLPGTPPPPARRGLERSTSFLVVAIVAAVGMGIVFWMGRGGSESGRQPPPGSNAKVISDDEVMLEFERLTALSDEIFSRRDAALIPAVYTADSPLVQQVTASLEDLEESNVLDRGYHEPVKAEVTAAIDEQVVIRAVVVYYPCFLNRVGVDVTTGPGVVEQTTTYTLRREQGQWQVHDAVLERDRVLESRKDECTVDSGVQ